MIRVAIVEDQKKTADVMKTFLEKYGQENQENFQIEYFSDGSQIVEQYKPDYDLIFMDIQMEQMDGMEAAKLIRTKDAQVLLIFVTNMPQFAVQGYEVDATGFLVKPVNYETFCQQMDKMMRLMQGRKKQYLVLNMGSGARKIDLSEVLYVESNGHYLNIHMLSEEFSILSSMKEMEKQLDTKGFFRCNSGYLINLRHVKSIDKNSVFVGDDELQISRTKKKKFLESLTEYIGGMK